MFSATATASSSNFERNRERSSEGFSRALYFLQRAVKFDTAGHAKLKRQLRKISDFGRPKSSLCRIKHGEMRGKYVHRRHDGSLSLTLTVISEIFVCNVVKIVVFLHFFAYLYNLLRIFIYRPVVLLHRKETILVLRISLLLDMMIIK